MMSDIDKLKIQFTDATIQLEIAQNKFNEVKRKLIEELNKSHPAIKQENSTNEPTNA